MIGTFKDYFYIALGLVVIGFSALFKMRGLKIEAQEREIDAHEAKDVAQDYEADNRVAKAKAEAQDATDVTVGITRI